MNLKKILLPLLMLPAALVMQAEVRVSLLTCEPGEETYEQYGHTAIRYEDSSRGMDVVFNYGMFSFNAPHFVWRFIQRAPTGTQPDASRAAAPLPVARG
jgi:hypothetical protein